LHELQTVYSVEDLYDLLEVAVIDAHNRASAADDARNKGRGR